jgi:hypothetical protein
MLFALTCLAAQQSQQIPAFPGNEAVRIVNGKRVVKHHRLRRRLSATSRAVGKLPPPQPLGEVFMIEGQLG